MCGRHSRPQACLGMVARQSSPSNPRQIFRHKEESLILQAQEKKGQTAGGVIRTEGKMLHPPWARWGLRDACAVGATEPSLFLGRIATLLGSVPSRRQVDTYPVCTSREWLSLIRLSRRPSAYAHRQLGRVQVCKSGDLGYPPSECRDQMNQLDC